MIEDVIYILNYCLLPFTAHGSTLFLKGSQVALIYLEDGDWTPNNTYKLLIPWDGSRLLEGIYNQLRHPELYA